MNLAVVKTLMGNPNTTQKELDEAAVRMMASYSKVEVEFVRLLVNFCKDRNGPLYVNTMYRMFDELGTSKTIEMLSVAYIYFEHADLQWSCAAVKSGID